MIMIIRRPFSGRACGNNFRLPVSWWLGGLGVWGQGGAGGNDLSQISSSRSPQISSDPHYWFSGSGAFQPGSGSSSRARIRAFWISKNVWKTARSKNDFLALFSGFLSFPTWIWNHFGPQNGSRGRLFRDFWGKKRGLNFGALFSMMFKKKYENTENENVAFAL